MTSESGAEYSFHEAFHKKSLVENDGGGGGDDDDDDEPPMKKVKKDGHNDEKDTTTTSQHSAGGCVFQAELIYPASDRQLSRAMPSPGMVMVSETPKMYQEVTKPWIDDIVASGSLSWLKNIVDVKKQKELLLWNAENWILNIDTKWRTHPDAFTVPRKEWKNHDESTADLYCLGILKQDGVATIRDLTKEHVPILREMLRQGPKVIEELYGIRSNQLRIFVHCQPQFYHFHVHFTRLENDVGVQVEKAHLLSDIIQNLEFDSDYYKKKTLTYRLSLKEKLCHRYETYEKKEDTENKK